MIFIYPPHTGKFRFFTQLNSSNEPFKFNAKELDEETGLYYYGARYYDPGISIWMSVHPLAEKFPGWSPYNYTFQNPINFTDPTGMAPESNWPPDWWKGLMNTLSGNFLGIDGTQIVEDANTLASSGGATDRKSQAAANRLGRASKTIETATGAAKETVRVLSQILPYGEESLMATYAATGQYRPLLENAEENAPYMIAGALLPGSSGMYKKGAKKIGKNFNKISDNLLKKLDIDAHQLKRDFLGNKAKISHYDLYKDNKSGEILILQKKGKGTPIQTGEFIK